MNLWRRHHEPPTKPVVVFHVHNEFSKELETLDALLEFQQTVDDAQHSILNAFREIEAFVMDIRMAAAQGEDVTGPLAALAESVGDLVANLEEHFTVTT